MTPGARVQAAIDILDLVIDGARSNGPPADRIVADWFRTRRFAGSGDRRAVRELVYAAIRACGEVPDTGRAAMLRIAATDPVLSALFDSNGHAPAAIAAGEPAAEGGAAPRWLADALHASGIGDATLVALLDRAPLDVRVNTLKADPATIVLPQIGEPLPTGQGLRFSHGTPVEQWDAFRDGLIEVQDAGSQLVCAAVAAQPGETVIDLCAGAGGKTLALAAAMDNRGTLIAADTDRARLSRLAPRAERAGAGMIEPVLLDPGREAEALAPWAGRADAVLVDAPCSGTGTWRRNPDGRWRLRPAQVARYDALQARLLDLAATLLRPGGRLLYVVCSLLDAEGADQAAAFAARHPGWTSVTPQIGAGTPRGLGLRLTPDLDRTDGFFIARFESPC